VVVLLVVYCCVVLAMEDGLVKRINDKCASIVRAGLACRYGLLVCKCPQSVLTCSTMYTEALKFVQSECESSPIKLVCIDSVV
jgi:hypothetical protein